MRRNFIIRVLAAGAVAAVAAVPGVNAQQVLQIDFENGRNVMEDDLRAIDFFPLAIDHSRRIIYVRDLEEPAGIMSFSLETGEWLRTYRVPMGDGPAELREIWDFTTASGGGLHVLGPGRALQLDSLGGLQSSWRLTGPAPRTICRFQGQPAVGIQGGLKRRTAAGGAEYIGRNVSDAETWVVGTGGWSEAWKWMNARLACRRNAAFHVLSYEIRESRGNGVVRMSNVGPDSVLVYFADGGEGRVRVPSEFSEEDEWNQDLHPSIDGHGDLVLASLGRRFPGAIVDPETGCYGVFRNKEFQVYRKLVGIHRDSAVVFHHDRNEETNAGQTTVTIYAEARQISLNPIRRVSGDRCAGMLPSMEDGEARERERHRAEVTAPVGFADRERPGG